MKKSKIYEYGKILRFIPIVQLIIPIRFELLRVRGFLDRFNLFLKRFVLVLIYLAIIVPTVLITLQFDLSGAVRTIIIVAPVYIVTLIEASFELREEKKVRESGFFRTEPDNENPS